METTSSGGVSWDQRNVLEFVNYEPGLGGTTQQSKSGNMPNVGFLLSWGHLSKALAKSVNNKPNAHVMLAVQTPIRSFRK